MRRIVNNPLGGMGLNGGIHDAYNLASTLVEIFKGRPLELLAAMSASAARLRWTWLQQTALRNRAILNTREPAAREAYYTICARLLPSRAAQGLSHAHVADLVAA